MRMHVAKLIGVTHVYMLMMSHYMQPSHEQEVMLMLKKVENEMDANADCLQDASYSWEIEKERTSPSRSTDTSRLLEIH